MERERDTFLFFNNFYTTPPKGERIILDLWGKSESKTENIHHVRLYTYIYIPITTIYLPMMSSKSSTFVFLLSFSLMRICSNLIIYRFVFNLFQIKFDFHLHLVNYWTHHQFCGKVSLCPFGICFLIIPLRESRKLPSDDSFICQETRNIFNLFLPKLYL